MSTSVNWRSRGGQNVLASSDKDSGAYLAGQNTALKGRIGVRVPPQGTSQSSAQEMLELDLLVALLTMGGADGIGQDGGGGGGPGSPSFQALQNWQPGQTKTDGASSVQGDPPADLAPPPGTTAQDIYNQSPKTFDNINSMKWKGEQEGDTFAKNNGFKNFDDMKNSNSPEAAKAMAKLQWVGTAANNADIQDDKGSHTRSADLQGGGLTGIRGNGEVDPNSTAAIAQDYIVHGQSMNGKTTKETDRVYADGTCKSNAQIVGKKIGDAIGKVLPFVKGISDACLDSEDEHHANDVDDTITAKEAHARIGKDVEHVFTGALETALMFIPGGQAVGLGARALDMGIEAGVTAGRGIGQAVRGTQGAVRGAEDAGQGARGAENVGRGSEDAGQAGRSAADPASSGQWAKVLQDLQAKLKDIGDAAPPLTRQIAAQTFLKSALKNAFVKPLEKDLEAKIHDAVDQALGISPPPQEANASGDVPSQGFYPMAPAQQPIAAVG